MEFWNSSRFSWWSLFTVDPYYFADICEKSFQDKKKKKLAEEALMIDENE